MIKIKSNIHEIVIYGICGVITTCINLFLFTALHYFGVHYIISNVISYFVAVAMNYYMNYKFVFKISENEQQSQIKIIGKFFYVRLGSLLIDSILFYFLVDIMVINTYVARFGLSFIIIISTFLVNKLFVFKIKKNQ